MNIHSKAYKQNQLKEKFINQHYQELLMGYNINYYQYLKSGLSQLQKIEHYKSQMRKWRKSRENYND